MATLIDYDLKPMHGQQSATSGWVRGRYRYLLLLREVAALHAALGELRTNRRRTAEKLFVWSFVCCLFGCFSSLLEVIIGWGCLLTVQS